MTFYQLYKKRGFNETLFVLYTSKNYACTLTEFFEKLEENSYYNAWFRVKNELYNLELISYRQNRNREKVISLTSKGVKIVRLLKEINTIMIDYEIYKKKMKKDISEYVPQISVRNS